MARAATQARTHVGLYARLAEREELAARNGWHVVQASGQVCRAPYAKWRAAHNADRYRRASANSRSTWAIFLLNSSGERQVVGHVGQGFLFRYGPTHFRGWFVLV